MKHPLPFLAAVGIAASALALPVAAQNASVTITVNGAAVSFDQPPLERAGRIYVPLRGVFEQLGASVVYQNGTINATRGSTTVALTIGNATATVNGQAQQLDSPPFVLGARTLVPLRFVAQALGANVSYNSSNDSVAITQAMPNVVITPVPQPVHVAAAPPAIIVLPLVRLAPADGTTVDGMRPQISATFPSAVRADALRIRIDGRDVTSASYVSDRSFSYDPAYDLPYGNHHLQIAGQLAGGGRFASDWSFANRPVPTANFFRDLAPLNGTRVGFGFTVHGFTEPGSQVHMVATTSDRIAFGEVQQTTSIGDVTAGPNGEFSRDLAVENGNGSIIDVRITSRAPDGTTVSATEHLRP
jgi:hypothetical protein